MTRGVAFVLLLISASCTASPTDVDNGELSAPAISAGAIADGKVTIDGTEISYVTITPAGFEIGDTAPVMFAFPPGAQDMAVTERVAASVYQSEAVSRGWVVLSPAAPNSTTYFDGSEEFVPGLLDWLATWVVPEGGRPHAVGPSNGGLSSFRAVAENPDSFASILVFPGYAFADEDEARLKDIDIPIRMFVGGDDSGWVRRMDTTFADLGTLGADVTYEAFPGEGHVVTSLSDGVRIFDELDALR